MTSEEVKKALLAAGAHEYDRYGTKKLSVSDEALKKFAAALGATAMLTPDELTRRLLKTERKFQSMQDRAVAILSGLRE